MYNTVVLCVGMPVVFYVAWRKSGDYERKKDYKKILRLKKAAESQVFILERSFNNPLLTATAYSVVHFVLHSMLVCRTPVNNEWHRRIWPFWLCQVCLAGPTHGQYGLLHRLGIAHGFELMHSTSDGHCRHLLTLGVLCCSCECRQSS